MPDNETVLRERYKIIREISRGGMGVVYLAKDLLSNQPVAVKKSFFSGDNAARRGFEIEAKLLARLKHEGLPKVLDYFILESGFQALVMEYIEGETLAEVLESGKHRMGRGLNSALVLNWALQILSILKYLHNFEPPIVHRDIKPNNIKINADGKIILLDFGLAKGSAVTIVTGMSGYSPIEQVNRAGTDPRSDIYALGTTLFHLLTDDYPLTALDRFRVVYGREAALAESSGEIAEQIVAVQRTVTEINPQVPAEISEIIMKAMALMPEDRFQTVEEMKLELASAKHFFEHAPDENVAYIPIDTVTNYEKNSPLFDNDEKTFEHLENRENPKDEISENNQSPEITPNYEARLNTTVASDPLFKSEIKIDNAKNYRTTSLPPTEFKEKEKNFFITEPFPRNYPHRRRGKKFIIAALGGFFIFLLSGAGISAWYLIVPVTSEEMSAVSTDKAVAVSPPEKPKNLLDVAVFRSGKKNEKIILNDDYQFAEQEKFKFLIKSPEDGFLYIITHDNRSKASLAYPKPGQNNNCRANSETFFPLESTFEFTKDTPTEITIYFIVVASREDGLAKQIRSTLDYAVEKIATTGNGAGKLIERLDEAAGDSAEINRRTAGSTDNFLVKVAKIQKKQ